MFKDGDNIIRPGLSPCTKEEMLDFCDILRENIGFVDIRGVD